MCLSSGRSDMRDPWFAVAVAATEAAAVAVAARAR